MKEIDNNSYTGKIKTFNGQFGFIKYASGEIFFHKTALNNEFVPHKNDEVEFQIKPSKQKVNMFDACQIILIKKGEKKIKQASEKKELLGTVKWFNDRKGFGLISGPGGDYFIHESNLLSVSISEEDVVIFSKKVNKGKLSAIKCELFIDSYNNSSPENQLELLRKYINTLSLHNAIYERIKLIAHSDKIEETVKEDFLKEAFERASSEWQYKMLFEDHLIDIQNESLENQIEVLQKINRLDFDKIKKIAQSQKIEETARISFLKAVFEKSDSEYQYRMLFDEPLIDIQKESPENQIEILQKLKKMDFSKIKNIAQSLKIEETVKISFLKAVFEKSDAEFQYKMIFDDHLIDIQNETPESQIKLLHKYLMHLGGINYSSYYRIKSIAKSPNIEKTVKISFLKAVFEKSDAEFQYKMIFDDHLIDIQNETPESQIILLNKILMDFGGINNTSYNRIKCIAQYDKIDETAKISILKDAFENASNEYRYKMIFEDHLIDIQNKNPESQIILLSKFLMDFGGINYTSYDRIKCIAQSDEIDETAKVNFLKAAFEKSSNDYQYKMLFDDHLIDIQNETPESQINLLRKLERLDFEKIKAITQSEKIDETAKDAFLTSAFEKADVECQYKLLFEDSLIQGISRKLDFLLNSTKCGRLKFSKGPYRGKTYFEVLEEDIEYLHKNKARQNSNIEAFYHIKHGYWSYSGGEKNEYSLSLTYKKWSQSWYSILNEVNRGIEDQLLFCGDTIEELNYKITQIYEAQELFEIFDTDFNETDFKNVINNAIRHIDFNFLDYIENYQLLTCIRKYNYEFYNGLFEQHYPEISKIDRLRLWLQNLNPYYYYLELVQSAWQLSNDERKLMNKRLKEHAKDERYQKFIEQIPNVELIRRTESTKTYKCNWRNLYYKNGFIQVFLDKYTSTEDFGWEASREEWNLLTQEYFKNRRIDDIFTTVNSNNHIIEITGLEDIEVKIVIAEVRKNVTTEGRSLISSSQITKIIHNVSARNECINFLASQNSEYNVLDIQELVTDDYGSLRRDISFIFPLSNGKNKVYLIWESAEFEKSKATHIFCCLEEELEYMENKIKDFIESNLRIRSRLNSGEMEDRAMKRELQYFQRVNHDSVEYQVWENRMREALPFLK